MVGAGQEAPLGATAPLPARAHLSLMLLYLEQKDSFELNMDSLVDNYIDKHIYNGLCDY